MNVEIRKLRKSVGYIYEACKMIEEEKAEVGQLIQPLVRELQTSLRLMGRILGELDK